MLNKNIQKKIDERQNANLQIIEVLKDYVLKYPEIRFGQALANLDIIEYDDYMNGVYDPFWEEPVDMLERVKNNIKNK